MNPKKPISPDAVRASRGGFKKIDYDGFKRPRAAAHAAALEVLRTYVPKDSEFFGQSIEDLMADMSHHIIDGERSDYNEMLLHMNRVAETVADYCVFKNSPITLGGIKFGLDVVNENYPREARPQPSDALILESELEPLANAMVAAAEKARDAAHANLMKKQPVHRG